MTRPRTAGHELVDADPGEKAVVDVMMGEPIPPAMSGRPVETLTGGGLGA